MGLFYDDTKLKKEIERLKERLDKLENPKIGKYYWIRREGQTSSVCWDYFKQKDIVDSINGYLKLKYSLFNIPMWIEKKNIVYFNKRDSIREEKEIEKRLKKEIE